MNYSDHYSRLITRAQQSPPNGYAENHHIIPKCVGGSNESSNLVMLAPEQHFMAHKLLVKIYPKNWKVMTAILFMSGIGKGKRNEPVNNKMFGWLKRRLSTMQKGKVGIKHTAETKLKMSEMQKGRKKTPEHMEKLRLSRIGATRSPESAAKFRVFVISR